MRSDKKPLFDDRFLPSGTASKEAYQAADKYVSENPMEVPKVENPDEIVEIDLEELYKGTYGKKSSQ